MGKRVKKALEAVAAQARTGDPAAIARYASEMSNFAAAEAKKKHGFARLAQNAKAGLNPKTSIFNPINAARDIASKAKAGLSSGSGGYGSGLDGKRALLRAHHQETIHPTSATANKLRTSEAMLRKDPQNSVAIQNLADASQKTKTQGKVGIAVATVFVAGGSGFTGSGVASAGSTTIGGTGVTVNQATSVGIAAYKRAAAQKTAAETGLTDTARINLLPNDGTALPVDTRPSLSDYASAFFRGTAPAAGVTAGAASSCGMASVPGSDGISFIVLVGAGCLLFALSFAWRVYASRSID